MTEMQHIEKQVGDIDTKVTSILVLLKGHELDKDDRGMIGIQNDHEGRIQKMERLVEKGKYFLIGISVPASWGIIDILQKVFLKH